LPKGWSKARVESIARAAETQTDDEAIAEAETAIEIQRIKLMRVPVEIASKVQQLIDRHRATNKPRKSTRRKAT
jgi:hypothetical protein